MKYKFNTYYINILFPFSGYFELINILLDSIILQNDLYPIPYSACDTDKIRLLLTIIFN